MKFNQTNCTAGKKSPWTIDEINACWDLYWSFLQHQQNGEKYVKAPAIRELAAKIGRSKGSVEAKMMNMSGVLSEMGCDYVSGFKPLPNCQKLLKEFIKKVVECK